MLCLQNSLNLLRARYYFFEQNHAMKIKSQIFRVDCVKDSTSKLRKEFLLKRLSPQRLQSHFFWKTFLIHNLDIQLLKCDAEESNFDLMPTSLKGK